MKTKRKGINTKEKNTLKEIKYCEDYVLKLVKINATMHIEKLKKEFAGNKGIEMLETFTKLIIAETREDLKR